MDVLKGGTGCFLPAWVVAFDLTNAVVGDDSSRDHWFQTWACVYVALLFVVKDNDTILLAKSQTWSSVRAFMLE